MLAVLSYLSHGNWTSHSLRKAHVLALLYVVGSGSDSEVLPHDFSYLRARTVGGVRGAVSHMHTHTDMHGTCKMNIKSWYMLTK